MSSYSSVPVPPESKKWTSVAPMSSRRSSVGVAVLNGRLYAVGGYDGVARQCLNSVEKYDPGTSVPHGLRFSLAAF